MVIFKHMKVSWITPINFVDVDLPIIEILQKDLSIYWQVVSYERVSDDIRHYIEPKLTNNERIQVEYVEIPYRFYDLRTVISLFTIIKKAKAYGPDLYYTSLQAAPFGPFIYPLLLSRKKTVAACHNVSTPKGANREWYARIFTFLHLKAFNNIQVFSEYQKKVLIDRFPQKTVFLAPLAIKDYGEPHSSHVVLEDGKVVFLFFGMILEYKRLDLLIEAAQLLYERGYKNFSVKIAGKCNNWMRYQSLIKYPEIFDLEIGHIPNDAVADLFSSCDYFIMPYQDIAQSGALTVAYRYNLPIIMSDLPQFAPYGINGVTGYFFESKNPYDLEEKMANVIDQGKDLWLNLKQGLSRFVNERYSTSKIAEQYFHFFLDLTQ